MRLARVCSGSREGPGLAERIARGRSPHVRVLELPGLACTPGLKGPRSRWVPALRPEQEWSRGFSLGLLHSRVLASRGQAPPVSCLGVQSAKDINRSMPHWKFSGELSKTQSITVPQMSPRVTHSTYQGMGNVKLMKRPSMKSVMKVSGQKHHFPYKETQNCTATPGRN